MHGIKKTDDGFGGFGEAYFSTIKSGAIKAWKRHREMTLNLIVPFGSVKFVMFDDRLSSKPQFQEVILSRESYCRLTVPPMIWVGFKGLSDQESIVLNVADIEHNPQESDRKDLEKIEFNWKEG